MSEFKTSYLGLSYWGPDDFVSRDEFNKNLKMIDREVELENKSLATTTTNLLKVAFELKILKLATLNGLTTNILIETFESLDDISLVQGGFDADLQKVYLP